MFFRQQQEREGSVADVRPLHVVHCVLSLNIGGLERNVVNQVREGQKLGQRVSVVCLDEPGILAPKVEALGVTPLVLGRRAGLRPGMILRVRRALAELRPDVVHTHQRATLFYAGAAARMLGVPVVVHTEHTREAYDTRFRTRLLGQLSGNFCDVFYCLTQEFADLVCETGVAPANKVRIIQNGIDISSFTESLDTTIDIRKVHGIPRDAPLIGVVARHTSVKALDVLIRAFARVRQTIPAARLVLVGDGPLRSDLERLAIDLGMNDAMHFAGFQPHSGPYLRAMDVFTLSSREEGMPQSALEAAMVGVPIVASRVGGIPEVVQDGVTGLLVNFGDGEAHARALCRLLNDRVYARSLADAARERVRNVFCVRRMAAEYHRDFLRILGGRGSVAAARR